MKKNYLHILIFSILIMLIPSVFVAKEKKELIPDWVKDFKSVYAPSKYIGYMSDGVTQDEAKDKSLDLISNYFNATIQSASSSTYAMSESNINGETSYYKKNTITRTVNVKSDVDLFGVEYNFYFNPKEKKYYCAAFIDKELSAQLILQRMTKIKKTFTGFYGLGQENEKKDSITALRYYAKSSKSAKEYLSLADYLALLSPSTEISENDLIKMSGIDAKVSRLASSSTISVYTFEDSNGVIESTIKNLFANEGFILKTFGETANYLMRIEIKRNIAKNGDVFIATPNINVFISNEDGTVFAYTKTFERFKAFNENTLNKQIETKLSDELKKSLIMEFYENI